VQCLHTTPEALKVFRIDVAGVRHDQACASDTYVDATPFQHCVQVLDVHPGWRPHGRQRGSLAPGRRHDAKPVKDGLLPEASGDPIAPRKPRWHALGVHAA
jgi:hypothetical protein